MVTISRSLNIIKDCKKPELFSYFVLMFVLTSLSEQVSFRGDGTWGEVRGQEEGCFAIPELAAPSFDFSSQHLRANSAHVSRHGNVARIFLSLAQKQGNQR